MINEKDKKIIDDFLKEQNFNFDEYDDFIEYIQARGMLNDKKKILDKVFFTKANLEVLYLEFLNPIKRVSKFLRLKYKELSQLTGYTEGAFKNAVARGEVSEPMEKALFLLLKIHKLEQKLSDKDIVISNLKKVLKDTLND
ncbi:MULTISPECIES: hypothetical protein [unclassified Campylobacter]|uniref:hypothetical protein n=1 Tax=unclassified Campylobacter TaxID=2593542 RepID=UPI0022EA0A3B|nr:MULTISPECIES: hypothetical protein [unclassified Campylobacter]MDA3047297.1 hypothetical protein [Campylobacter sp. JMF_08 NE1]MDA3054947.1 hypothetical protein [Campylobacter sp. VBCF_07 NA4]MDA3060449.1 hypothetical protein [Campylobacter sp. VBCF_02 NA5]MDA3070285.1 hypothetical protein [Campylobacter sp. VBCF_08 NA3]WBR54715.1 hypothetical protein PF027_02255 [Campylobacter sp. VBCF_01 NA2]